MAVYLTKPMLSKMNNVKYYVPRVCDTEVKLEEHWNSLFNNKSLVLAREFICRVCARNGCVPLMEKIDEYDAMSAIRTLTNINISADDSLPKFICSECLDALKGALYFKKLCEQSDRQFRKILNPEGDPALHSYPYSKRDFHLILHQMKLKRLKVEDQDRREKQKQDRLNKKKSPKIKQFRCSPCDLVFPNKKNLLSHRRERQCMRRACEVCGQLVVSIAQHMRHIHKQNSPHKCTTCFKEFPTIARLKNHMIVHTNTFNFFCDQCPYKSKHKYYLVLHMRTHTGEKPYKCPQCPATFVNPSNLNKHKLTHEEKRFKCMMCDKAFRTNTAMREHDEAAHMNIKHTCSICARDFCYKADLRKHEIRYHNRMKRDYVGGEPTYKQVERLQKMQGEEWSQEPAPYETKDYVQNHQIYFSDVTGLMPHQTPMVTVLQDSVTLIPELTIKKDDLKVQEPQTTIGTYYAFHQDV